jgi:S-adenosylmethionine/arginine decarboxylase-like enzyme
MITPDYPDHGAGAARYGWELVLDLHDCPPPLISDPQTLIIWVTGLVKAINMKPYGEPTLQHFGHDNPITSGYTVVQLIETSSIVAHLSPLLGTAHIDVFSCRWFNPHTVIHHCEEHLGGTGGYATMLPRG